jgi:hypothetical protein
MNWKGFGSKQSPVRMVDVLDKISAQHLLSIKQEHYIYANPSGFTFMTEINVTVFSLQESMKQI